MGSDVRVTLTVRVSPVHHCPAVSSLFVETTSWVHAEQHRSISRCANGTPRFKMYLSLILILIFYQVNQREQFDDEHRPKIEWNTYFQNLTKKYTKQLSNYLCLNVIGQQFRLNHWLVIVLILFPFHHSKAGFDHSQIDADQMALSVNSCPPIRI